MDRIAFKIYIPDKRKFRFTPDTIVLIMWILLIIIFWALEKFISPEARVFPAIAAFLINMFYLIRSFVTYADLRGRLEGQIEFKDKAILINDEHYDLEIIKKIDFYFGDYYGKVISGYKSVNPRLSQGVNNSVEFTTLEGAYHNIQFKVRTKKGHLILAPFISNALKQQKIPHFKVVDLIGEENIC